MLKKVLLFAGINLCCVIFVVGQNADKDRSSLNLLTQKLLIAQTGYDAAVLDSIMTADYVEISPVGEIDRRAKVLGFYTPEAKRAAANVSVKAAAVVESTRIYNKFAVVIATFNYEMIADGKEMPPRSLRATLVYRKEGEWKLASAQYTGIRRAPGPGK